MFEKALVSPVSALLGGPHGVNFLVTVSAVYLRLYTFLLDIITDAIAGVTGWLGCPRVETS